jgi:hypothetical protein
MAVSLPTAGHQAVLAIIGNRQDDQMMFAPTCWPQLNGCLLKVIATASNPGASWTGHRGRVDQLLLDEVLPAAGSGCRSSVCSTTMMDGVEHARPAGDSG